MPDSIPTVEDLTSEWFTDLLRRNEVLDATESVATASLAPFGEAESMMSALFRVDLT